MGTLHFEVVEVAPYKPIHNPTEEDTPENIEYCMSCPLPDCKYGSIEACKRHNCSEIKRRNRTGTKSGVKGVSFCKFSGKWLAYIDYHHKRYNLGRYMTIEEAAKVRREAEELYFG